MRGIRPRAKPLSRVYALSDITNRKAVHPQWGAQQIYASIRSLATKYFRA